MVQWLEYTVWAHWAVGSNSKKSQWWWQKGHPTLISSGAPLKPSCLPGSNLHNPTSGIIMWSITMQKRNLVCTTHLMNADLWRIMNKLHNTIHCDFKKDSTRLSYLMEKLVGRLGARNYVRGSFLKWALSVPRINNLEPKALAIDLSRYRLHPY